MNEIEKAYQKNPLTVGVLIFALQRLTIAHKRFIGPLSVFNLDPPLDFLATKAPGRETWRIPPWFVDAASTGLALTTLGGLESRFKFDFIHETPGLIWKVMAGLLIFRVILFPLRAFLHVFFNVRPVYRPCKTSFILSQFPGCLFRSLFIFDVVIPQAVFSELVWGKPVALVVFGVSFLQFVFRVFFQRHKVYLLAPSFRPLDSVVSGIGVIFFLLWILNFI